MKKLLIILAVVILLLPALYIAKVVYIVDETQYAIKTRLGEVVSVVYEENWRVGFRIPGIEELYLFPAKVQSWDASPEAIVTLDKKNLIIDNYFKWKIDSVVLFRNSVGNVKTANNRLESIVHDAVKDVLGNTTLSDIVSGKQEEVIRESLKIANRNSKFLGVNIGDIRFKKVQLPKSNEERLFERMKSERYKEAAFYRSQGKEESIGIISETDKQVRIIQAEAYKTSQEIRGKAEALSAEIYANAFSQDPEFYSFWRTLQTYRNTLDSGTTLVISPKSELYQYLSETN